ncbi:inactive peptidyl-prolyl cis-trans isomerase FKBP6-like isoform X2 [Pan paniscus]|uniref:inactive peptidyl-prolyl cis-trans isomerase FKBP6-like isoform X2 n=1 Tax=Pan paniscus TaxID=9597 RepID=UPI003007F1C4
MSASSWPQNGMPPSSLYERLSQRMLDISGDRGVLKDVIREGAGDLVAPDASVLDITLWGMELGLLSMRRGELARFLFKPNYAYGTLGSPPLIPPNTTVLFEIELLDFLDCAESDKFCALSAVRCRAQMSALYRETNGLVFLVILLDGLP